MRLHQGDENLRVNEAFVTNKDDLAFEQERMRERWAKRPHTARAAAHARVTVPVPFAILPHWKTTPEPANPAKSVRHRMGRDQNQEPLALGFSLGVPPVRAGYSTATIEYACACGAFSINPHECPRCGRRRQGVP